MAKKSFPCYICGKVLTRSFILMNHLKSHADERHFQCSVCGKAFVRANDCKQHEAIHKEEPKYVCEWRDDDGTPRGCGRQFRRKADLVRHHGREEAASCWRDRATVSKGLQNAVRISQSSPRDTIRSKTLQQPLFLRSELTKAAHLSAFPSAGHFIDLDPSGRLLVPVSNQVFDPYIMREHLSITMDSQGSGQLLMTEASCDPLDTWPSRRTSRDQSFRNDRDSSIPVTTALLRQPFSTALPALTSEVHRIDTLWRVSLIAGFVLYGLYKRRAFFESTTPQPCLDILSDFYSKLLRNTYNSISLKLTASWTQRDPERRPDMPLVLRYAAHVMRDMAPIVGDANGAAVHS